MSQVRNFLSSFFPKTLIVFIISPYINPYVNQYKIDFKNVLINLDLFENVKNDKEPEIDKLIESEKACVLFTESTKSIHSRSVGSACYCTETNQKI